MPCAIAAGCHGPTFVEDVEDVSRRPGRERRLPIHFLVIAKALTADVRDRKMRQRKVAQVPATSGRRVRRNYAHAEKCHFKSVPPALLRSEVTGEVPPFSLVFVMTSVVARKLEVEAGERGDESRMQNAECRTKNEDKQSDQRSASSIHGDL